MRAQGRDGSLLVTGGTGAVGSRLAALLASAAPGRLLVAARDGDRARRLADEIGHGARGITLDVNDPSAVHAALESARLVVNCVPLREPLTLLRAAVEHGVAYTDISPATIWEAALSLSAEAVRSGARVVVGAGLAPGASNLMARALAERLGVLESIDVTLLFHLGDEFGDASLESLLDMSQLTLAGTRDGAEQLFRPFSETRRVALPEPLGLRKAWRAPFTDQLWLGRSLGVRSAATWLALEPRWAGHALAVLARSGLLRVLANPARARVAVRVLRALRRSLRIHGASFALIVEARASRGEGRLELAGQGEPRATAIAASLVARALLGEQPIEPGVWFPEQVIAPAWFLPAMATLGLAIQSGAEVGEKACH